MNRVIIAVLLMLACSAAQAEWIKYAVNAYGTFFYDPERVVRLDGERVAVWIMSTNDAQKEILQRKSMSLPTQGFNNYSHSLTREILNCRTASRMVTTMSSYATDGTVIENARISDSFSDIIPDSIGDILMNLVCKAR